MNRSSFILLILLIPTLIKSAETKETAAREQIFAEEVMPGSPTRALLIFFDDSENGIYAINSDCLIALKQKAAPILVSRHILATLHSLYLGFGLASYMPIFRAGKHQNIKEILAATNKILAEKLPSTPPLTRRDQEDTLHQSGLRDLFENPSIGLRDPAFVVASVDFNPEDWIIKALGADQSLVLLIPRSYSKSLADYTSANNALPTNHPFTPIELELGLKIDHMAPLHPKGFLDLVSEPFSSTNKDYLMQAMWDSSEKRSSLFITRTEYRNAKKPSVMWAIYITGHGTTNETIANIPIDQFKQFLVFLDSQIFTKFLAYSSCYAAGVNLRAMYEKTKEDTYLQDHSFAIALEGITELPTPAPGLSMQVGMLNPENVDFEHRRLRLMGEEIAPSFDQFIRYISGDPVDYQKATLALFKEKPKDPGVLPQIKLPGMPFFSIIDLSKYLVVIGTNLALARDPHATLSIKNFFPKSIASYIGLQAHEVPFPINIDVENWHSFISMIPGHAVHVLSTINAPNTELSTYLDWTLKPSYRVNKTFWIKSAVFKKRSIHILKSATQIILANPLNDLIVAAKNDKYSVYFTYDKKTYKMEGEISKWVKKYFDFATELSEADIKDYQALVDSIKNDPALLEEQKKRSSVQAIGEVRTKEPKQIAETTETSKWIKQDKGWAKQE